MSSNRKARKRPRKILPRLNRAKRRELRQAIIRALISVDARCDSFSAAAEAVLDAQRAVKIISP